MYEAFYGFREKPFHVTADPAFLYPSRQHQEALAHLLYGIRERLGFILILGEVGTGKTTLAKTLIQKLDGPTKTALILNPALTGTQLLRAILRDFEDPEERSPDSRWQSLSRGALLVETERLLLRQAQRNGTAVLIMDEAQTLSVSSLEQIRLLSNIETAKSKLLQIVLIGQPELGVRLAHETRLKPLQQRITVRYHIHALEPSEVAAYVQHRLEIAGVAEKPRFSPEALIRIAEASRGIPRQINQLCDQALVAGFVRESMEIDESMVEEALAVTGNEQPILEVHYESHR
ncbi:MAG: AAA family ATPase [Candidatus Omnitrophica bacterium]|nr:AAA family ATPase [Candidatus Omnitrophota bacterium]